MRLDFIKCHGSGNDFPLIDARALDVPEAAWPQIARALADRAGPVGGDGLLLLTGGDAEHAFGMRMFNSDGSEAETCLNGLRCTARLGIEGLGLDHARVRLKTSSADVARVDEIAPGVVTIETRVGPASTQLSDIGLKIDAAEAIDVEVPGLPSARRFTAVAMPNPHLVTFVEQIEEPELVALGSWCEAGPPLIPGRVNVSFVEARSADTLYVRTFERGVGLTDSCGSAMAASTFAAGLTGRVGFGTSATVFNRGGLVRAHATAPSDGARVTIAGNASFEWEGSVEFDPAHWTLRGEVHRRDRSAEVLAWASLLASIG